MTDTYDVVVVGAGPPGENAADRVRRAGLTAVVVEHELVGGECSYWACMPSKALLRPVEVYDAARGLPGVARVVEGGLDTAAVLERRDSFVHHHDDASQVQWLSDRGIDLVRGHGRLAGKRVVEVATEEGVRRLRARHAVVLAVGTTAAVPPVPGLREVRPWTSREATNATTIPRRLVVLGGGVVACEMAQAMRALGAAEVTIVARGRRLLGRVEPFAAGLLADALREQGVTVRVGSEVHQVRRDGSDRGLIVTLADAQTLTGDEILVALGRTPATSDLGLDTVGLTPGRYVAVDDAMHVLGGWLYACGDVTGRNLLTHMGKYQARVCGDVIGARATGVPAEAPRFRALADEAKVPQVVFTDPQVCAVGLTEQQAVARGARVRAVTHEIGSIAGAALLRDGYTGQAKIVVDEERRVLLGATFVGPDLAELLHSATVAVVGEVPLDVLWDAVPSYPTVSEIWLRLLEAYGL